MKKLKIFQVFPVFFTIINIALSEYQSASGPYPAPTYSNYYNEPAVPSSSPQAYNFPSSAPASGSGPIGAAGGGVLGLGAGPVGPGPVGAGLGPGPLVPGGIPPPFLPFSPFSLWPTPLCAALQTFRVRLQHFVEPVLIAGVGLFLFWFLKTVLLPHVSIFATAFKNDTARNGFDLDNITNDVMKAINSGICYQQMVCTFGKTSRKYKIAKKITNFVRKLFPSNYYFKIFTKSVNDDNEDCSSFTCSTLSANFIE